MSHSTSHNASRVLEQRNLLGGTDLVPLLGGGKRKRARKFHVAAERRLGFAVALALVVEHGRQKAKERGVTSLSKCPRCGHVGPTDQDFGTRIIRGERRPQSWCRSCRAQHLPALTSSSSSSTATSPALKWSSGSTSSTTDGWLFPPETLRTKPPGGGKRHT